MMTITKESNFGSLYSTVADCYSTYTSLGNHYAEGLSVGNTLSGLDFGSWNDEVSGKLVTFKDQLLQGLQAISNDLTGGNYVQLGTAIETLGNILGQCDSVKQTLDTLISYKPSYVPDSKDKKYRSYQTLIARIRAYDNALTELVSAANSVLSQIPSITFGGDFQFQAPAGVDISGLGGFEGLDELIPDVSSQDSAFNGDVNSGNIDAERMSDEDVRYGQSGVSGSRTTCSGTTISDESSLPSGISTPPPENSEGGYNAPSPESTETPQSGSYSPPQTPPPENEEGGYGGIESPKSKSAPLTDVPKETQTPLLADPNPTKPDATSTPPSQTPKNGDTMGATPTVPPVTTNPSETDGQSPTTKAPEVTPTPPPEKDDEGSSKATGKTTPKLETSDSVPTDPMAGYSGYVGGDLGTPEFTTPPTTSTTSNGRKNNNSDEGGNGGNKNVAASASGITKDSAAAAGVAGAAGTIAGASNLKGNISTGHTTCSGASINTQTTTMGTTNESSSVKPTGQAAPGSAQTGLGVSNRRTDAGQTNVTGTTNESSSVKPTGQAAPGSAQTGLGVSNRRTDVGQTNVTGTTNGVSNASSTPEPTQAPKESNSGATSKRVGTVQTTCSGLTINPQAVTTGLTNGATSAMPTSTDPNNQAPSYMGDATGTNGVNGTTGQPTGTSALDNPSSTDLNNQAPSYVAGSVGTTGVNGTIGQSAATSTPKESNSGASNIKTGILPTTCSGITINPQEVTTGLTNGANGSTDQSTVTTVPKESNSGTSNIKTGIIPTTCSGITINPQAITTGLINGTTSAMPSSTDPNNQAPSYMGGATGTNGVNGTTGQPTGTSALTPSDSATGTTSGENGTTDNAPTSDANVDSSSVGGNGGRTTCSGASINTNDVSVPKAEDSVDSEESVGPKQPRQREKRYAESGKGIPQATSETDTVDTADTADTVEDISSLQPLTTTQLNDPTENPGKYDPYTSKTEGYNALTNGFNNAKENVYSATVDLHDGRGEVSHFFTNRKVYEDCVRFSNMNEKLYDAEHNTGTPITLYYKKDDGSSIPVQLSYAWGGGLSPDTYPMFIETTTWNSEYEHNTDYRITGWGRDGYGNSLYFSYINPNTGDQDEIRAQEIFDDPSWQLE